MNCPHCQPTDVSLLQRQTHLGYPMFRCKVCRRKLSELGSQNTPNHY